MKPSYCDVKIQFNFITDPVHFISLGAKLLHRAAMCHIVLRWTDFLQIYSSVLLASKQLPSWHDRSYRAAMECSISSLFGLFLVFWHLGPCLDSFSCFCRFSFVFGPVLVILLLIIILKIP
ncbi:hypothetical protein QL285_052795 [Trifolium repens]|nr:hypothetical protein QL285_052795 [Trifolium repens]